MTQLKFNLGESVTISKDCHWAQGAKGKIVAPPIFLQELVKDEAPWEKWHRFVKGKNRIIEFYYVEFDKPQYDADGDGPYKAGEIEAEMIERSIPDGCI